MLFVLMDEVYIGFIIVDGEGDFEFEDSSVIDVVDLVFFDFFKDENDGIVVWIFFFCCLFLFKWVVLVFLLGFILMVVV